jgi:hypothetical protein
MDWRHPLDPPGPYQAAPVFGLLLAQGLMGREECLGALLHAARDAQVDRSGLRSRLANCLSDHQAAWDRARLRARWQVRDAVLPVLDRRAPAAAIREAARTAGAPALRAEEADELAAELIAARLRGRRHAR